MEPIDVFLDGEWDCLQKMFAAEEGQFLFGQDEEVNLGIHSIFYPTIEADTSMLEVNDNLVYSSDALNSYSVEEISQRSSYSCPLITHSTNILASDRDSMYMDIPYVEERCAISSSLTDIMMEDSARLDEESNGDIAVIMNPQHHPGPLSIPGNQMTLKRKVEVQEFPGCAEDKNSPSSENKKKKPPVPREVKKSHKQIRNANVEEEIHAVATAGHSYSSCSTEEDSVSQEMNGGVTSSSHASTALHCNGKTRASRGSATDIQSLGARKRRERINERLRILQNLVPNGTKVDISTMLEEAVHYVKFLQLQIKLLSSDDLWMYAPIAYNRMDMVSHSTPSRFPHPCELHGLNHSSFTAVETIE